MLGLLEDILTRETPVPPAELTHLVQRQDVQRGRARRLQGVALQGKEVGARRHVREKRPVVARPVGAEVFEDRGQRRVGHGDLEEVVAERDL